MNIQEILSAKVAEIEINYKNKVKSSDRIKISWDTSYAGNEPISYYEILSGNNVIGTVKHVPQVSKEPFSFTIASGKDFKVVAVDAIGRKSATGIISFS